jgi:hypothetical protein
MVSLLLDGADGLLFQINTGDVAVELAVRITESPAQKVNVLPAAISGFAGRLLTVIFTRSLAADTH